MCDRKAGWAAERINSGGVTMVKSISRYRRARSRAAWTAVLGGLSLSFVACQDAVAPESSTPRAAPAARFTEAPTTEVVPDEYIVVFDKNTPDAPGLAKKLSDEAGGKLHKTFSSVVKGFSVELSPEA